MLTAISIRDVVLIERLDISFDQGLTVLTGETGAGKSILLDSLGLALGARADAGLVRAGAAQASVTACFAPPAGHPSAALLAEQGLDAEDDIVLRRVLTKDGRTRAFINDQPVGVALLRRAASLLVEVQGQHEQIGLADPASHAGLLDAFGVARSLRDAAAAAWRAWRAAVAALEAAHAAIAAAQRDEDWLRHAVEELAGLAPQPDEEDAARRRSGTDCSRASGTPRRSPRHCPSWRRTIVAAPRPAAALRAACRALQRLVTPAQPDATNPAEPAIAALERAEEALAEAESFLTRLAGEADADPRLLEQAEERLFALRAVARKHAVAVADLPALLDTLCARLAALETGAAEVVALEQAVRQAREDYVGSAAALAAARRAAAARLDRAVAKELPPLRLDKARFHAEVVALEERDWGPAGTDAVRFLIATNPGQELGPLGRIASGGELSRLMLALKVVLSSARLCRPWCSTRSMPMSGAPRRRRSASGWRGWRSGCRCWW